MDITDRIVVKPGARVRIIQKQDQRSGRLTEGIVADVLTKSLTHPHGGRGPGLCPGVQFRRTRPCIQTTGEWRAEGSSLDGIKVRLVGGVIGRVKEVLP